MLRFPVMMMPLRPGHLLLPTVEVKPVSAGPRTADGEETKPSRRESHRPAASLNLNGTDGGAAGQRSRRDSTKGPAKRDGEPTMTCETDYRNQAQAVLVRQEVRCTSVTLDGPPEGAAGDKRAAVAEQRAE